MSEFESPARTEQSSDSKLPERFNRRYFLKAGVVVVAALTIRGSTPHEQKSELTETVEFSLAKMASDMLGMYRQEQAGTFEGALAITRQLKNYLQQVEGDMPEVPATQEALKLLTLYIAPFFTYEGIVDPACAEVCPGAILPDNVNWNYFINGARNFHELGNAQCVWPFLPNDINMNFQFTNPFSEMSARDSSLLITLTHELGHIAGICPKTNMTIDEIVAIADEILTPEGQASLEQYIENFLGSLPEWHRERAIRQIALATSATEEQKGLIRQKLATDIERRSTEVSEMESANQLATTEVLAAMAMKGNPYMFPAFLRHMVDLAGSYTLYLALRDGVEGRRYKQYKRWRMRAAATEFERATVEMKLQQIESEPEKFYEMLHRYGAQPYEWLIEALRDPALETRKLKWIPNADNQFQVDAVALALKRMPRLVKDYPELVRIWGLEQEKEN